ncbi:hypothetical protein G3N95_29865 [Paraburkholderia sp. Tr-20389]|nr:hypothetical protein [Paraburkholderia sp. Tr-20389]MBN3757182.1 hypothetical protein [Paraburkholderia sp. Tr-20389]
MKSGYRFTFAPLQYGLSILVEYICRDGHRIVCRKVEMDWQANFCWQ